MRSDTILFIAGSAGESNHPDGSETSETDDPDGSATSETH